MDWGVLAARPHLIRSTTSKISLEVYTLGRNHLEPTLKLEDAS